VAPESVGPKIEPEHETQVADALLEVTRLTRKPAQQGQDRAPHEDRVTHLAMERHRFTRSSLLVKSEVGCGPSQLKIAGTRSSPG
jgi:hypothetical protein